MAILGRRQPHAPIILRPGTPASVARVVYPNRGGVAQAAALFSRRPLFRTILKTAGPPASVARIILSGDRASRDAAIFARRPLFQPIFKRAGPPPSLNTFTIRGQGTSKAAALAGRQPYIFRPFIRGLIQYAPPVVSSFIPSQPLLFGQRASQRAANLARQFARMLISKPLSVQGIYTYSGSNYYEAQLTNEINAAGLTTGTLQYINGSGATGTSGATQLATVITITFDTALSAADVTTLNTTVTNHVPHPPADSAIHRSSLLANGGFDFFQRWGTASFAIVGSEGYGPDRWRMCRQNADFQTRQIDTLALGNSLEPGLVARCYAQFQKGTNTGKGLVLQIVEARDTAPLANRTVTFQVKMKANVAMTIRLGILQLKAAGTADTWPAATVSAWGANTADPTLGTNLGYLGTASAAVTTAWQRFVLSVTLPSNALNVAVALWSDSQLAATNTLSVAEAVLSDGPHSVEFLPADLGSELLRCQRYYQKNLDATVAPADGATAPPSLLAITYSSTRMAAFVPFPVSLRIVPTITFYRSSVGGTSGQWAYKEIAWTNFTATGTSGTPDGAVTTQGFNLDGTDGGAALTSKVPYFVSGIWTADAEL